MRFQILPKSGSHKNITPVDLSQLYCGQEFVRIAIAEFQDG